MSGPKFLDRPGGWNSEDLLDRGPFIESLVGALVTTKESEGKAAPPRFSTGFVVGLTGVWGSGKSTVLNHLEHRLTSLGRTICFHFNPWLFKGREELLLAFMRGLLFATRGISEEYSTTLANSLDKYWEIFLESGAALSFGNLASVLSKTQPTKFTKLLHRATSRLRADQMSLPEAKKAVEKAIKDSGCAIVVLIDELDRVEDEDIRTVAQLIKAVGDIEGISYLVAYDAERVVRALGTGTDAEEKLKSGRLYIEKIIQYSIPIRPLFDDDVEKLISCFLEEIEVTLKDASHDSELRLIHLVKRDIQTPREIKRLLATFKVLSSALGEEISQYDLLAYCWILVKAPDLQKVISRNVDKLVLDPALASLIDATLRNEDRDKSPSERVGLTDDGQIALLNELFVKDQNVERATGGNRINLRRNLVRVLYLGDPPGSISLQNVKAVASESETTSIKNKLENYSAPELANFVDRLSDGANLIPEADNETFWLGICSFLADSRHTRPEAGRDVISEFAGALQKIATRDPRRIPEVVSIIQELASNGDLTIVPEIVRRHLFAYGKAEGASARGGDTVLSAEQLDAMLVEEVPRYARALTDPTSVMRLRTLEPLFVILNLGEWNDELRERFTSMMKNPGLLIHISTMLTPPGVVISPEAFGKIFDVLKLRAFIEHTRDISDPQSFEGMSLKRMHVVALGYDLSGVSSRELDQILRDAKNEGAATSK